MTTMERMAKAEYVTTYVYGPHDKDCWLGEDQSDKVPIESVAVLRDAGLMAHRSTVMSHRSVNIYAPPSLKGVASAVEKAKKILEAIPEKTKTLVGLENACRKARMSFRLGSVESYSGYWSKSFSRPSVVIDGISIPYYMASNIRKGIVQTFLRKLIEVGTS